MPPDTYAAVVLPLPRIEALVGELRRSLICTPAAPIPAHVTLATPLPPDDRSGLERLRRALAQTLPFPLNFAAFGRFPAPGVLYLAPEPTRPLLCLTELCFAAFPRAAPEFPDHVFHATLAQAVPDLDAAEAAIRTALSGALPIVERIDHAALYVKTDGAWALAETLAFAGD